MATVAFRNANLIDGTGAPAVHNATVLVEGDRTGQSSDPPPPPPSPHYSAPPADIGEGHGLFK